MSNVIIKSGNLLEAPEEYILHQCNCVTNSAKGLALSIFQKWKFSDTYSERVLHDTPGTIKIRSSQKKTIINLFAQYYPGRPKYKNDSREKRLIWFEQGLDNLLIQMPGIKSIALPFKIGCGLGGGVWRDYLRVIEKFSERNFQVLVVIYKL